ncbi:MAG TPA: hypothetical protein VEX68_16020 [Bryobacteraceae bacterium]|nr:hypothetical protein [Bryobacteraceae bacterium]
MGRILFLSAVALMAYKYIARSNEKHQPLGASNHDLLSPPASTPAVPAVQATVVERVPEPKLVAAGSRAVEPDPGR